MNGETVKTSLIFHKTGFSAVLQMDCLLIVKIFSIYFYLNIQKENQELVYVFI